jgi:hypothetical protein
MKNLDKFFDLFGKLFDDLPDPIKFLIVMFSLITFSVVSIFFMIFVIHVCYICYNPLISYITKIICMIFGVLGR